MAASETSFMIASEKTITASGTAEALVAASTRVKSVLLIAKAGNTGQVYVGGSTVDTSTNDGLDAGESITVQALEFFNLTELFLDVDTNGEGVDFYAAKS